MKTSSNRFLLALVLVVICVVFYLAWFTDLFKRSTQNGSSLASPPTSSTGGLERMAKGDPVADAAQAIRTNDLRFVAISGLYAPPIPGVPDYDDQIYTNGINWVDGHGRGLHSPTFEKALEYAAAYNKTVLAHLKQTK